MFANIHLFLFIVIGSSTALVKIDPQFRGMDNRDNQAMSPRVNIYHVANWMHKQRLITILSDPRYSIYDKTDILYELEPRFNPMNPKAPDLMAGGLRNHDFFTDLFV